MIFFLRSIIFQDMIIKSFVSKTYIIQGEVRSWAADEVNANATRIEATCFPFHTILFAIGNPSIDYFSLDVEGVEVDILKAIPWNKVDIKVNPVTIHLLNRI